MTSPGSAAVTDPSPLVDRVDALLKRHQDAAPGRDDLPVLTEVVDPSGPAAAALDTAAVEALSRELERAVLARLEKELQPALAALGDALRAAVRDAVAHELQARKLDADALAAKRSTPPIR
jgi:hypothetical protein